MAAARGNLAIFVDKVYFLKKLPELNSATDDDGAPTPGYIYKKVSDLTLESGSYCQEVLGFLLHRLQQPTCYGYVKFKTLKIMRFVVAHGHPQFRQCLRRNVDSITEATKFSGPVGSSVGRELYENVRHEAKGLCEELFRVDDDDSELREAVGGTQMRSTGGMGSDQTSAHTMQGFGNTGAESKRSFGAQLATRLVDFVDAAIDPLPWKPPVSTQTAECDGSSARLPDPPLAAYSTDRQQSTDHFRRERPRPRAHQRGVAGGGWDDSPPPSSCDTGRSVTSGDSVTGGRRGVDVADELLTGDDDALQTPEGRAIDSAEVDLVNAIVCCPAGTASSDIPSRREIASFRNQCALLNCDVIVACLNRKLTAENQTTVMRSLVLVESLLNSDLVNADGIAVTCHQNLARIRQRDEATTAARAKCRKLLLILQKLANSEFTQQEKHNDSMIDTRLTED